MKSLMGNSMILCDFDIAMRQSRCNSAAALCKQKRRGRSRLIRPFNPGRGIG